MQVLNLFNERGNGSGADVPEMPDMYRSLHFNDEEVKRRDNEEFMKQLDRFDDNVKHAILLRREKDAKSEFYRKLETLTERIHMYKSIFYTKTPSFLKLNDRFKKRKSVTDQRSPLKKVRSKGQSKNLPNIRQSSRSDLETIESSKMSMIIFIKL